VHLSACMRRAGQAGATLHGPHSGVIGELGEPCVRLVEVPHGGRPTRSGAGAKVRSITVAARIPIFTRPPFLFPAINSPGLKSTPPKHARSPRRRAANHGPGPAAAARRAVRRLPLNRLSGRFPPSSAHLNSDMHISYTVCSLRLRVHSFNAFVPAVPTRKRETAIL
jgi:hypothetical protein